MTTKKRSLPIALHDYQEAQTSELDGPMTWYLDLETGEVGFTMDPAYTGEEGEFAPMIEADPDRFLHIPVFMRPEHYRLMERFAASQDEDDVRALLERALRGRGAFRRFREAVQRYPDISAAWEARLDACLREEAELTLEELGIEPEWIRPAPVLRLAEPAPPPPKKRKPAAVDVHLYHLLALGGPVERAGDVIRRRLALQDEQRVRPTFKRLARELCEQQGIAWRNRYIEAKDRVGFNDIFIAIDGTTLTLELPIDDRVWAAFDPQRAHP